MEIFPTGQERKDLIARNAKSISKISELSPEKFHDYYTWRDSSLDGPYDHYDLSPFSTTFHDVLPRETGTMKKYIEQVLAKRKGSAIGIEFGGIGSEVFSGFTKGFFKRSIGVTLVDNDKHSIGYKSREEYYKNRVKEDEGRHHEVMEGNIFSEDLYKTLEARLQGEQADLILERLGRGLESVPPEPYFASKFLAIWYRLLREEGVLFAQIPIAFGPLLKPWTDMIQDRYQKVLEVVSAAGSENRGTEDSFVLRIRKLRGAPSELPLLDPKTVRDISRGLDL